MNTLTFAILLFGCFAFVRSDACDHEVFEDFDGQRANAFQFRCQLAVGTPTIKNGSEISIAEPEGSNGYYAAFGFIKCFETSNLWFTTDIVVEMRYYLEFHLVQIAEIVLVSLDEDIEPVSKSLSSLSSDWRVRKYQFTIPRPGYYKIRINADDLQQEDYLYIDTISIKSAP